MKYYLVEHCLVLVVLQNSRGRFKNVDMMIKHFMSQRYTKLVLMWFRCNLGRNLIIYIYVICDGVFKLNYIQYTYIAIH